MGARARYVHPDESGLTKLEILGLIGIIVTVLALIPFVRNAVVDLVGVAFDRRDPDTGELTQFSDLMRGIFIAVLAVLTFVGAIWLVLATNLGNRLSFLVIGTGLFAWLTIGSLLFVVYAPRGIRPENIEGLNAFQIRVPAIALTLGCFVLLVVFLVALDRYEREDAP